MGTATSLLWFRHDLRLNDNPALCAAVQAGRPILPVFIWAPGEESPWRPGLAGRWWLRESLARLDRGLRERGSMLVIRRGDSAPVLAALARESNADGLFYNACYEPAARARDKTIEQTLRDQGVTLHVSHAALLANPENTLTRNGRPYHVFTPFWRAFMGAHEPEAPARAAKRIAAPTQWPESLDVNNLPLPVPSGRAGEFAAAWCPGEEAACAVLEKFLDDALQLYPEDRDYPGVTGTSRLSPYLHFGEIGPRAVWRAVHTRAFSETHAGLVHAAEMFVRQLVWREFAHHILFHAPHTDAQPLRPDFAQFPWRYDDAALEVWQKGQTGYPLVDAGMRELRATGWMHNRIRMVTASFLTKHLLIPWQAGARWFWDNLVDADLANNAFGWQWVAGSGADAVPYFRIFNPALQGENYDPHGGYVRHWVPELAQLSSAHIHRPWKAPEAELRAAGVHLGKTYPQPMIAHEEARARALFAYETMRQRATGP